MTEAEPAPLMKWSDLTARYMPKPQHTVRTGEGTSDVIDVWLPRGNGPHPVIIMVHGGCWQKGIADRTLMNYAAEDLRQQGLAVWNIEYRGVDEEGGGYPGSFQDVAKAADALRDHAAEYNFNMDKVAGVGHSAGGHLVAWLSTRANLPKSSPLYKDNPLPLRGIINSGGLADLEASAPVTFEGCLASIMDTLVGEPTDKRPNVFSDTSPTELFPSTAMHMSLNGNEDTIAPPRLGAAYTAKAVAAGMKADFVQVPATGHVELVSPGTEAFDRQVKILQSFFRE
ncbi:MAG: alpha/beta hydrolase [Alphaproteobacteria bacterium]